MGPEDWESVKDIYREGIETGQATFESEAPEWAGWDAKHLSFARLVAFTSTNEIAGWAALSPVSTRAVYSGVAEVSVYVAAGFRGQGVGSQLMKTLISESEQNGIWTLQSSIFPENAATLLLHQASGFRVVGRRERIGRTANGAWRDTLLMERRSQSVGLD
jgi:phosphinothricin acetyltransferase